MEMNAKKPKKANLNLTVASRYLARQAEIDDENRMLQLAEAGEEILRLHITVTVFFCFVFVLIVFVLFRW
jgi:hypothetical protein